MCHGDIGKKSVCVLFLLGCSMNLSIDFNNTPCQLQYDMNSKKSCIRETLNLSTDADRSTNTIFFWGGGGVKKKGQKKIFFFEVKTSFFLGKKKI